MTTEGDDKKEDNVPVSAVTRILQAIGIGAAEPHANRRGEDDDYRQIVADLLSDDRSPFVPADMDSLNYMSSETLRSLRDKYLGEDSEVNTNQEEGGHTVADKDKDDAAKANSAAAPSLTVETVTEIVTNAVAAALANHKPELSAEDKLALNKAKEIVAADRAALVTRIVANSAITKEAAEAMDDTTLATVANGLRPVPDYAGRSGPTVNTIEKDDKGANAMVPPKSKDYLPGRDKKELN